jgi:hypothetical protein
MSVDPSQALGPTSASSPAVPSGSSAEAAGVPPPQANVGSNETEKAAVNRNVVMQRGGVFIWVDAMMRQPLRFHQGCFAGGGCEA